MLKTIDFFETKGKAKLKEDYHNRVWYSDFLEFVAKENIFAILMTPSGYGASDSRFDYNRINMFNELVTFYGLGYWYTWHVSMLGLGPIWLGNNEKAKQKAAKFLQEGAIFAFGLSEKEHGADLISSEMTLKKQDDGTYLANGSKYYIGNGNKARMVSVFAKVANEKGKMEYVYFVADSQHENYDLVQNVVASQNYVSEFRLKDYPITEDDILCRGREAWDVALATIAFCKFNLGSAAVGMVTHAYNKYVTDLSQSRQLITDAYCRLLAMKLFMRRATDYLRTASEDDKRYLLYTPMAKMKVTMQAEKTIHSIWDVIAAKGFEKNMFFEMATIDVTGLPKLEGTAHVNMILVVKFMQSVLFEGDSSLPEIPQVLDLKDDDFLFNQGSTSKGQSEIKFHSYEKTLATASDLDNLKTFISQVDVLKKLLTDEAPDSKQNKDTDFMLALGEIFTLVPYAQLIVEEANFAKIDRGVLDQIFDVLIRDFSGYATGLFSKRAATEKQRELCLKMIKAPVNNEERFEKVYREFALGTRGTYQMNP